MSNPLIRDCNHYIVLEPGREEKFLKAEETIIWLESWLSKLEKLPKDLEKECSLSSAAKRLLDTACDLEISPGVSLQWFAVRINY